MEFLLLASAHFLALLSPGPDFFLIMQASLRLPLRYGFAICAGIALGNALYLTFAVVGFELIRETSWLFLIVKYLGSAYLIFIGILLLRAPRHDIIEQTSTSFLQVESMSRQFVIGFASAVLNPKNMIFYLSLFTAMVSVETSFLTRSLYGVWMVGVVFFWDCLVVMAIGRVKVEHWLGGTVYYLEKFSGLALASFGLILPFT